MTERAEEILLLELPLQHLITYLTLCEQLIYQSQVLPNIIFKWIGLFVKLKELHMAVYLL